MDSDYIERSTDLVGVVPLLSAAVGEELRHQGQRPLREPDELGGAEKPVLEAGRVHADVGAVQGVRELRVVGGQVPRAGVQPAGGGGPGHDPGQRVDGAAHGFLRVPRLGPDARQRPQRLAARGQPQPRLVRVHFHYQAVDAADVRRHGSYVL